MKIALFFFICDEQRSIKSFANWSTVRSSPQIKKCQHTNSICGPNSNSAKSKMCHSNAEEWVHFPHFLMEIPGKKMRAVARRNTCACSYFRNMQVMRIRERLLMFNVLEMHLLAWTSLSYARIESKPLSVFVETVNQIPCMASLPNFLFLRPWV